MHAFYGTQFHTHLAQHFLFEHHHLCVGTEQFAVCRYVQFAHIRFMVADDVHDAHHHAKRVFACDM